MSSVSKRRLFVNHRNHPELVEALANVPRGTYYKYAVLREQIPELRSTEYWSNQLDVQLHTENFKNQLKKNPKLQRLHDFMTKGIGEIEISRPGQTKGARRIKKLLEEAYFSSGKHFRQFFIKSPYVKNWYDYVILVRQLGVYW